eukprot:scaffold57547_cov21-Prasinocladus_malaysianus.AAC.1
MNHQSHMATSGSTERQGPGFIRARMALVAVLSLVPGGAQPRIWKLRGTCIVQKFVMEIVMTIVIMALLTIMINNRDNYDNDSHGSNICCCENDDNGNTVCLHVLPLNYEPLMKLMDQIMQMPANLKMSPPPAWRQELERYVDSASFQNTHFTNYANVELPPPPPHAIHCA